MNGRYNLARFNQERKRHQKSKCHPLEPSKRKCTIPDCDREYHSGGYCGYHYWLNWANTHDTPQARNIRQYIEKHPDYDPAKTMQYCRLRKIAKKLREYSFSSETIDAFLTGGKAVDKRLMELKARYGNNLI